MYGLSKALSGKTIVQITPIQTSLAVALAAGLHLVTILLTTLEVSVEVPFADAIYLKLVSEGDGAKLSASEPSLKLSSSITPPTMANQVLPTTDLISGKSAKKLQEITKQNTSILETILSKNIPLPSRLTPITSAQSISAKSNIELEPSRQTKLTSTYTSATDDISILQTPPTPSFMSRPEAAAKQTLKQKSITSVQLKFIEPARLKIPTLKPTTFRPSWPHAYLSSTYSLPFLTTHSGNVETLPAPINVIPPLAILDKPKVMLLGAEIVEVQEQIVVIEGPTELSVYQHRASETIAEPLDMNKTVRALLVTPSKVPTTAKAPPEELPPDPLASVLRKIAEIEKNQKNRDMSRREVAQSKASSVPQRMVKARSVEGADSKPLNSNLAGLINSQIMENWHLPPGLVNADLQPVLFRVLLDRNGAIVLIQ